MRFRSNPLIELTPLERIAEEQRELFRDLESDPDCYGILVPKPPLRRNLLSVSRQTAELFRALATPSALQADDDVIDLVLDGVLELESGDGFVSGADALALLCGTPAREGDASLSHRALLHAQDLETGDAEALTNALYGYNRIPITPFWQARFADAEAILEHVGANGGSLRGLLERGWIESRPSGFVAWSPRLRMPRRAEDSTFKLYVSPRPERIRDAFATVVRVLAAFPATPFKIGDDAAGLLRPDKLVLYFWLREDLDAVANELRRELAGCEPHGVPFTAPLGGDGLLSWGVDPPDTDRALQWLRRDSWRYWVARRLGAAVAMAKTARTAAAAEPWQFAIERARRHGIDVETWTPSAALWG